MKLKSKLKEWIITAIVITGIAAIVTVFWYLLEIIFYGQLFISFTDTIIGGILTASLFYNFTHWMDSDKQEGSK